MAPLKGNGITKTDLPQLASGISESDLEMHLHRVESEHLREDLKLMTQKNEQLSI